MVVRKYTFWGIAFGCFFPLMAVALQVNADGLPWRVASVATVHSKHITLWVVNLAPLVLGLSLLEALSKRCAQNRPDHPQDVLIEVHTSGEASKPASGAGSPSCRS